MEKILKFLEKVKNNISYENYWNIPSSVNEIIIIPDNFNNYEKNIYLKENFKTKLKRDHQLNLKVYYWIIREWGGIKSFRQNDKNNKKILKFLNEIEEKKLSKTSFETISSLSKVISFVYPEKYAIYDSRAVYSLNWLILKYASNKEFFPIPSGRNKKLSLFKLETIIALFGYDRYKTYKNAYYDYCDILSFFSQQLFNNKKPYLIEMLLFYIADNYIINDIKNSLKIEFV